MANQEQMAILRQGAKVWNVWRTRLEDVYVDLSQANLSGFNLRGANLFNVNLALANLSRCDLSEASLIHANLRGANLNGANLTDADVTHAYIGWTAFGDRDLRLVKGLENAIHEGPSPVSINTIYASAGLIPEAFLRGAGTPDIFIEYIYSLTNNPIEYFSCFISYSSKDECFAKQLHSDLQLAGIRCWFAAEHMKIGDIIRHRIDESIRQYDKLLLVLSKHSVMSKWVAYEVEAALDREQPGKPPVLFPLRVDGTAMDSASPWASHIRRTRHIGNFESWEDHDEYQKALNRLLHDLKAPG